MKAIWIILLLSVVSAAADEKRTWTFIEDGVMRCPPGGGIAEWSFKKDGRVDAAFIGLEGTNVVVLAQDNTHRIIPVTSLSESDRVYLKKARGISEEQAEDIKQKALASSAESQRKNARPRTIREALEFQRPSAPPGDLALSAPPRTISEGYTQRINAFADRWDMPVEKVMRCEFVLKQQGLLLSDYGQCLESISKSRDKALGYHQEDPKLYSGTRRLKPGDPLPDFDSGLSQDEMNMTRMLKLLKSNDAP